MKNSTNIAVTSETVIAIDNIGSDIKLSAGSIAPARSYQFDNGVREIPLSKIHYALTDVYNFAIAMHIFVYQFLSRLLQRGHKSLARDLSPFSPIK